METLEKRQTQPISMWNITIMNETTMLLMNFLYKALLFNDFEVNIRPKMVKMNQRERDFETLDSNWIASIVSNEGDAFA